MLLGSDCVIILAILSCSAWVSQAIHLSYAPLTDAIVGKQITLVGLEWCRSRALRMMIEFSILM